MGRFPYHRRNVKRAETTQIDLLCKWGTWLLLAHTMINVLWRVMKQLDVKLKPGNHLCKIYCHASLVQWKAQADLASNVSLYLRDGGTEETCMSRSRGSDKCPVKYIFHGPYHRAIWSAMSRFNVRLGACLHPRFFSFFFHLQKKQCWSGGLIVEHRAISAGQCDRSWLRIKNAAFCTRDNEAINVWHTYSPVQCRM